MESKDTAIHLESIVKMLQGILSGGATENIIRGVIILLLGIGTLFVLRWLKKREIEAAQRRNSERQNQNQNTTDRESQDISEDANQSEDRIEDILEE